MPSSLLKIWMWGTRVYALLCIAAIIATETFHLAYPQSQGIPGWLYVFVWFPAVGIEILPVIFLIDVILAVKGIYRRPALMVQAILELTAFCFCLLGLRQAPAPPPKVGMMVRTVRRFSCLTILLASLMLAQPSPDVTTAMAGLRKEPFRAHMAFLADDLTEGRGTGTRGHELAARYIAAQFEALGLEPGGPGKSYFQRVPLIETTLDTQECAVTISAPGSRSQPKWGEDFIMQPNGAREKAVTEGPVVFAGYGVTARGGSYDDYAAVDASGKIAAVLAGAPASMQNEVRAHFASVHEKIRTAANHGATGLIVLFTREAEKILPWSHKVREASLPSMNWVDPGGRLFDSVPEIEVVARFSEPASKQLFRQAAKTWTDILRDAAASRPQAFPLGLRARLQVVSHHRPASSPNVVAVVPGSDARLRREYVVYSAHADHLGIGQPVDGDAIYNGAVDDASGIAALLVIAGAFKSLKVAPARSIVFLATTGEEKGHLGASYFARYPFLPIEGCVADINMDWTSVFYTFDEVVALGAEDSSLGEVVKRNAARLNLKLIPDPQPEDLAFIGGEEYAFVRQGVPAIMLAEGVKAREPGVDAIQLNKEYSARYHSPSDDMHQSFNFDASVEYMQIAFLVGYDVAQNPQRPIWKPGDFFGKTFGRN